MIYETRLGLLRYDAVTIEGELRWQSSLNSLNAPYIKNSLPSSTDERSLTPSLNKRFFSACDSLFLDYHWLPPHLSSTISYLTTLSNRQPSSIFVGIDIFGRGQYGGGGFDSFVALSAIRKTNLSIALFAPGWTVESDQLNHDLSTRFGYQKWLEDENHLWTGGGKPSPQVVSARKRTRGIERANFLALTFTPGFQAGRIPSFDYHAPLPPSSSILSHCPRPRTSPSSNFFTNFNTGSGHAFFYRGRDVWNLDNDSLSEKEKGWTDIDLQTP